MPGQRDPLDDLLRQAFEAGIPEPEYAADQASPVDVPADLRARLLQRASDASSEILGVRLREAGEAAGWTMDELAAEVAEHAGNASILLTGHGDPRRLPAHDLARLFRLVDLDPSEWSELLAQAVASHMLFSQPLQGQVWGRTTGLTGQERAEALVSGTPPIRDPDRARKVAQDFVEEVIDEWKSLAKEMSADDPESS